MKVGDVISWERSFTPSDVKNFSELSGDWGRHHTIPDDCGRLVVQGLLTATLPTKLGGDLNVLARNMEFTFLRPVYTGDVIRCEATITQYERQTAKIRIASVFACYNQDGGKVMEGSFQGVIKQSEEEQSIR
ncbi:hotdog domain-containing protein [Brevibacillus massiliensis]|jgi:acyl dehydratase|uniref:hotdog domain-containing protein n=1 Tax=Brevibacillus massiliensis TaxID=1118054 RepID=UPI0002F1C449|nr:hotdog domain-containing protein [Brevibacillus massiliensis]